MISLLAVLLMLCTVPLVFEDSSAGESPAVPDALLVDFGNGHAEWKDIVAGSTLEAMISSTIGARAVFGDRSGERTVLSVDGVSEVTVGTGVNKQTCYWRIYAWNTVEWEFLTTAVTERYSSGFIALGYYPSDVVTPVSNPDYREVWTSYRGDSSSSGVSTSKGPETVATPLEWTNTYPGAVDASILYADGMIYHTVAGKYGAVGMDALARINCLDPVNRELLWSVTYSNSGNTEITTPVIVGNLIIVTSGNWHMYAFDRFTGDAVAELAPSGEDGDICKGSKLTSYIPRKTDPSVSGDRIHLEGGITNTVYDSGALYFGTSDGLVRCFSIDREKGFKEIWNYAPDSSVRGCFYYHPPVICDFDGTKYLLIGNYGGGIVCLNAINGSKVWERTVTDTQSHKVGQVASITVCSGGRALVCYSGGEMSSAGGGIALVDITDGSEVWKQDIRCGRPVVYGDRFYCYISALSDQKIRDSTTNQDVDLVSGYYGLWVNDGSMLWSRPTDALSIGGTVYSDGKVYSMDYSPGTEGTNGGNVWCIDADTGSVVWRCKVSPYNGNAYSMNCPTVVDGKVLVGNDYGAIYVISETSGNERAGTENIEYESQGLAHPSWIITMVIVAIVLALAVMAYRR